MAMYSWKRTMSKTKEGQVGKTVYHAESRAYQVTKDAYHIKARVYQVEKKAREVSHPSFYHESTS